MITALFEAAAALGAIIGQGVLAGFLAFLSYVAGLHAYEWSVKAWRRGIAARDQLIREWEGK